MALKVGINALFLERPFTGSGQYLTSLVAALRRREDGTEYCLLLSQAQAEEQGRQVAPAWLRHDTLRKMYVEQLGAPLAARAERLDVLHYPYFAAPLVTPAPCVVTVHDVIPLLLEDYRGPLPVRAYMSLAAATTSRASIVVCDSVWSQRDAIRVLGLPPERARVVYLAAGEEMRPASEGEQRAIRERYGLERPFIFYIGGLDRRKNLGVLLEAFSRFQRQHSEVELVIAGGRPGAGRLFPDWQALAERLGIAAKVRFIGPVSEAEKAQLYSAGAMFCFPSLYEGFGLPPLEAMACATPVLCANATSLPEVTGDAAQLLPTGDPAAWSEAMRQVYEDDELRQSMISRGLQRASTFSWDETARQMAEVYQCASY